MIMYSGLTQVYISKDINFHNSVIKWEHYVLEVSSFYKYIKIHIKLIN